MICMALNIFEIVNDKFFNPLTNPNKRLYYDLLSLINEKMNDEMKQFPRDELISWIVDYLENCPMEIVDNETNAVKTDDNKKIASDILRYFVICGWLLDENDTATMKTVYQMDSNAILLLNTMNEIVKNDSAPLEYTSYVYSIYNALYNFQFDHSVDIVEQMEKNTRELVDRLRGLNGSIKKYLKKLLSNDNLSPREILNQFLVEYQEKVIIKNFKNLKEKDNPAKYKTFIISKIEDLFERQNFDKMVAVYINKKFSDKDTIENRQKAEIFYNKALKYVEDQFESIEDYIDTLDKRNAKYVSTANARISFLINENTDIEGKIIELLKNINDSDDYLEDDTPFKLYDLGMIDEESLYQPRNNKKKVIAYLENIEQENIDEEEIARARQRMFKEEKFNCYNVNKFVIDKLGKRDKVEAKDIDIENFDDLIKLFLACLYSSNKIVDYKITFFNKEDNDSIFTWQNKRMTNYMIERK